MSVLDSTITSRFWDFVRLDPPIFIGSRMGEDPQEFLDGIYKIVDIMGVTYKEKEELAFNRLKEVAKIWFAQLKDNWSTRSGSY